MARSQRATPAEFHPPGKDTLAPVYLLHGEEDLLCDEALQAILDVAVPPEHRSFNLDVVQWGETDVTDIIGRASAFPMMADRRAVVVKDIAKPTDDDVKRLTSYVENPVETTVLILTSSKVDTRKNPFAAIQRAGTAFKFDVLRDYRLPGWISRRLAAKGLSIEENAAELLASFASPSLRDLDQELEKLVTYAGDRTVLTIEDVSAVAGISKEHSIFGLQHAIAFDEPARAVEILTRMIHDGNGAPYFVVMLTLFFSTVRRLHDYRRKKMSLEEIASELQRNPFTLKDAFEAANRFSVQQVEKALGLLLGVDDKVKLGGDDLTLLQTMLIELFEPSPDIP